MEVVACISCRRLFNYISGEKLCPECKEEMDKCFADVKEYLYEHKGASIKKVSEEFDIPERTIHRWLKEGRLELSEGSMITLECEGCGANITSGRFCNKCLMNTKKGFQDMLPKKQASDSIYKKNNNAKMHTTFY